MRLLSWFKREPKPRETYTVTEVQAEEGYWVVTLLSASGAQYKTLMPTIHPLSGAVNPEPSVGTEAVRTFLETFGRYLWQMHIGDNWWPVLAITPNPRIDNGAAMP